MAYVAAMITIIFVAIIAFAIWISDLIKKRRSEKATNRRIWIKQHFNEIVDAFQKKGITIRLYDHYGIPKVPTDSTHGYDFVSSDGKQTRVLTIPEFYDILQQAEKSNDVHKLIFGKYLYRQFNVK
ncbi:hypothetical protein Ah1_00122 [Aeromonas phage Ah1]|uniref:Uncharacterized protein n=1 Tax=Aeromonas phage Ah1 TaxID=2053701 RepID=A0A2H4YES1_9CAUD|nr:hypothetical protein KNT77_gp122 [Aeromonas phage Ah1]AUE22663.1 hypothetical protein Ah1_00122 [Aeromonas phage Ah1]UYD60272.1 hypothetical protein OPFAMLBM_00273 [Aeromonas phage avDM12-TAAL]